MNGVRGFRFGLCFRRLHLIRGTSLPSKQLKADKKKREREKMDISEWNTRKNMHNS